MIAADIASLPKVELHRHLEGSIRPKTFEELARACGMPLPGPAVRLCRMGRRERGWETFQSKFRFYRDVRFDRDSMERVAREAIEDAAADRIRYLELRFSPVFFARRSGARAIRCAEWIIRAARREALKHRMEVHFLAGLGRDKSLEINRPTLEAAVEMAGEGFVGLDLASDERAARASRFREFFRRARKSGLRLSLHAGEICGPEAVREAIVTHGAERIGHGVRVMRDPRVIELARRAGTVFEVCPTSNLRIGAARPPHPLGKMQRAGLAVTVNTDDPAVFGIDLNHEMRIARRLGVDLWEATRTACRASFGGDGRRLERELAKEWTR